jgi:hypothetical protein
METAHLAHFKVDPIGGSSKKVNKTKILDEKNEENSECFQLYFIITYQI